MENMELKTLEIYKNKKIFITGNTGFKGSWLAAFLTNLQVNIEGYALAPETKPNHYSLLNIDYKTTIGDIEDKEKLYTTINKAQPDVIFHLAAQALVKRSYTDPVKTYETNVIGTLNVLEAAKKCSSVQAIVIVTTDKVYENKEWEIAYKETDELGGYDMYSSSKACCELLIRSYRNCFFNINDYKIKHDMLIASARAGNVIGGGDWSIDRLLPDIAKAAAKNEKVIIRNPRSVRPWQHVLDCLYGYLLLGAKLLQQEKEFADAWNFSPYEEEAKNVEDITTMAKRCWSKINIDFEPPANNFHEAGLLILDNSKAITTLGWRPVWNTATSIERTIDWYKNYYEKNGILTFENINSYLGNFNKN